MADLFQPRSAIVLEGSPVWANFAPHPALARHVSALWTVRFESGEHTIRTLPDACADLTIDLVLGRANLSGPRPTAKTWQRSGESHLLGARLFPGVIALLGVSVEELEDGWTPLDRFFEAPAVRRLERSAMRAKTLAARVAVLEAFLATHLVDAEMDPRLEKAIDLLFREGGNTTMATLAERSGAHARTLSRLFEKSVGLTPKRFARVVRFQAAVRALHEMPSGRRSTMTELAIELGYHDQAHFIREVRELFGMTPSQVMGSLMEPGQGRFATG